MYIYSNTSAGLLFVETAQPAKALRVLDSTGAEVACPVLRTVQKGNVWQTTLDAEKLAFWSVDTPVLYTMECDGERQTFGHVSIRSFQNKHVLLNDSPVYMRGYIRGITAHEHPNMTGGTDYEAAQKNIRQAKKYGFNAVRFHSTIPSEEFVQAADELGLLVHMEIGFAYEYDSQGNKKNLAMNNEKWEQIILKYRNHPSVAIFCIGNEMHRAGHYPQVRALYEQGKALAPSKLILDNSGWGEYDRTTADIYCQHIAYYFPYAHHADMFNIDAPWRINGSCYDVPLTDSGETSTANADIYRVCVPIRPTLSHEAMHYIDIPDYEAMNAKFDAFAQKVGQAYLEENGIEKPRYLTALPELIAQKGLQDRMPGYQAASRYWKLMASKIFMERIRYSDLCGFEMLQFSDCLKYENKNGIVDFFDDDKGIDPVWMRQVNSDLVLLADVEAPYAYEDETLKAKLYVSNFLPQPQIMGTLQVLLDGEVLYTAEHLSLAGGLQSIANLDIRFKATGKLRASELKMVLTADGQEFTNSWKLWLYPRQRCVSVPELALSANEKLAAYLAAGTEKSDLYVTDTLSETLLSKLEEGKTAVLLYEHLAGRNTWQLPGALERFKPCIWDRGSNLGGIVQNAAVKEAVSAEAFFDLNMQPLLEAGYKVNLDHFPCPVEEHIQGIDKPVRDRMKGLLQGISHFIADDTLRKFSHLFSLNVGKGKLIVCTFNLSNPENPVVANLLKLLIDGYAELATEKHIGAAEFKTWLDEINVDGIRPEDVMNHFWEIDNKPVEDKLFWEEAKVDLSKKANKKK